MPTMSMLRYGVLSAAAFLAGSLGDAPGQVSAQDFLSVEFEACGRSIPANERSYNVEPERIEKLLNGVWVGTRIPAKGTVAEAATYAMLFDMQEKEALTYEERGGDIKLNAFDNTFAVKNLDNAPTITYFYCGGKGVPPFKDVFVKVSDDPADGIEGIAGFNSLKSSRSTISALWEEFKVQDQFRKARAGGALLNTARFTVSLLPFRKRGADARGIRLDLVGEYRGSPEKYVYGQPVAGLEGGIFQGATGPDGDYIASVGIEDGMAVLCFCDPTRIDWDLPLPLTNFQYTKVVIGPIP